MVYRRGAGDYVKVLDVDNIANANLTVAELTISGGGTITGDLSGASNTLGFLADGANSNRGSVIDLIGGSVINVTKVDNG